MAYWVKIGYERDEYIINLDRVSAFVCSPNGRIRFWLPDSKTSIVITPQSNPEEYEKILNFVAQKTGFSL